MHVVFSFYLVLVINTYKKLRYKEALPIALYAGGYRKCRVVNKPKKIFAGLNVIKKEIGSDPAGIDKQETNFGLTFKGYDYEKRKR